MERLIKILSEVKPGVDFATTKGLVEDGVIDSFDIVTIIAAINDEFDIEFPVMEVMPETFNDVESLYAVIQRLEEE